MTRGRTPAAQAVHEAQQFVEGAKRTTRMGELTALLSDAARALGFDCVTLVHHLQPQAAVREAIAYSDYPEDFLAASLARRYIADDPVLAACERSAAPFLWSDVGELVTLNDRRREILARAAASGLQQGLTIPVNVPGEPPGSCSFGLKGGDRLPHEGGQAALWVGVFAFEQARRLVGLASSPRRRRPTLSPRQLDCVVLTGQGKSDWAIAELLGLSQHTVHEYIEGAKRRYEVASRQQLLAACLADGHVTYADVLSP
jgi:LuxR family quorum-sensing system transcriptional regulator CciR